MFQQLDHMALVIGLAVVVYYCTWSWFIRDRRLDKMPGPKGLPFIGVGISLPDKPHVRFREWATRYGEVFKIRVGWYNWVIINSPAAMQEVLNKQSLHTSSKMPAPLGNDVVMGDMRMFTLAYGPKWRAYRNITHQLLSSTMTATFVPSQEFEVKQLLFDLATDNKQQTEFQMHIRRFAFSIMMTSTYGLRVTNWDDQDLPFLARLPVWLQPGRRRAQAYAKPMLEAKMILWRRLQRQIAEGGAPVCYARELIENSDAWRKAGLKDEDAAWVAGGNLEAGSTTTSVTLLSLILHLAADPHVQKTAYDELARVVRPGRAPCFDDVPNLPYIRACVKEILRMHPTPFWGIKHYADVDATYKDYVIPKGTILLGNTPFIHYDPSRYDEPFVFKPERYLGFLKYSAEYANQGDPYQRDHFTFGVGRRICPGSRLAENSLDIAVANILWAFEVRPPLGEDGVEEVGGGLDDSDDAWEDTSFRGPKPFEVRFVPRDGGVVGKIEKQWEKARQEGYVLRGQRVDVNGYVQRV
ncbi:putative O-methylsterigmatocystin oxidoreductase [Bombardia bombarda]|uniref:O-methylsterigmatocystin oxidoreductase n=1 Tax=Bombardia bombarda TaxID=252184 RepID=A0AA39XN24_9PEZI|nr:putative O-methylsterigmatocystin oxidoreductase [Bombardia bombarda]